MQNPQRQRTPEKINNRVLRKPAKYKQISVFIQAFPVIVEDSGLARIRGWGVVKPNLINFIQPQAMLIIPEKRG